MSQIALCQNGVMVYGPVDPADPGLVAFMSSNSLAVGVSDCVSLPCVALPITPPDGYCCTGFTFPVVGDEVQITPNYGPVE